MNYVKGLSTSNENRKEDGHSYVSSRKTVRSFTRRTQLASPWEAVDIAVAWWMSTSRWRQQRPWLQTGRRHRHEFPNRSVAHVSLVQW